MVFIEFLLDINIIMMVYRYFWVIFNEIFLLLILNCVNNLLWLKFVEFGIIRVKLISCGCCSGVKVKSLCCLFIIVLN